MVGYNTDQFYKLPSGVATTAELSPDSYSNPKFLYPGSTRKHSENGHWTDKGGLQRGFMRMLPMSKGDSASEEMKKRRFFFQFNPSNIVRDLSMRDDVRNPLLLSPSEFSVPTPGMTSFGFELFLDRTAELNNKSDLQVATDELNGDAGGRKQNTSQAAPDNDPLLNGSPSEVGVLADIRVLDTIIGAGITADMMNYIIERGKINSSYATSDSSTTTTYPPTGTDASATTTTTTSLPGDDTAISWDSEAVRQAFDWNVGNQAFLFPNPVRVVFSSLFMVEGYVTGVTVSYPKFNEAMVPMQCSVAIQMQALYMGFAKNDTYFTWALDQAEAQVISGVDNPVVVADQAQADALKALAFGADGISGPLSSLGLIPTYQSSSDSDAYALTASAYNRHSVESDDYVNGVGGDGSRYEDFLQGVPACFGEPTLDWKYVWKNVPNDDASDPIYKKFTEGAGLTISFTWNHKVYRKALTDWEKANSDGTYPYIVGEWSKTCTASTADEWKAIRAVAKDPIPNSIIGSGDADYQKWGRGLFIRTSPNTASLDTAVWKANAAEWSEQSDVLREVMTITGSISDTGGNSIPLNGYFESRFKIGNRNGSRAMLCGRYVDITLEVEDTTPSPVSGATGGTLPVVDRT